MPKAPQELKPEFTVDVLLAKAKISITSDEKCKYELLASYRRGEIDRTNLPRGEQATLSRYIRDINKRTVDELLVPHKPGPSFEPLDLSPGDARAYAAKAENEKVRLRALTLATYLETNSFYEASKLGLSEASISKLVRHAKRVGVDACDLKVSAATIADLKIMLNTVTDLHTLQRIKAALAVAEGKPKHAAAQETGIPPGTIDGLIDRLAMGGAIEVLDRADKRNQKRTDPDKASHLLEIAEKASDPTTSKRCGAVGRFLQGAPKPVIWEEFEIIEDTLTRWVAAFKRNGVVALMGAKEFDMPYGTQTVEQLQELAQATTNRDQKTVLIAATSFYMGKRLDYIDELRNFNVVELFSLLWALQRNRFQGIKAIVETWSNAWLATQDRISHCAETDIQKAGDGDGSEGMMP